MSHHHICAWSWSERFATINLRFEDFVIFDIEWNFFRDFHEFFLFYLKLRGVKKVIFKIFKGKFWKILSDLSFFSCSISILITFWLLNIWIDKKLFNKEILLFFWFKIWILVITLKVHHRHYSLHLSRDRRPLAMFHCTTDSTCFFSFVNCSTWFLHFLILFCEFFVRKKEKKISFCNILSWSSEVQFHFSFSFLSQVH